MYRGVASEIRTQFLCFLFLGFLSRVYTFAFWDQLLNQFKNYNFKIKYFDVKRSLWKVSKESKSCSHQTRGILEDFKNNQNSWPKYGNTIFVLCFEICISGVVAEMRVPFLRFSKIGLFGKNLEICFLMVGLWIYFLDFNFRVKGFKFKLVSPKSQKPPTK